MALYRDHGSRVNRRQLPWRQAPRNRADTRALAIAGSNTPNIRYEGVAAFIGTCSKVAITVDYRQWYNEVYNRCYEKAYSVHLYPQFSPFSNG